MRGGERERGGERVREQVVWPGGSHTNPERLPAVSSPSADWANE